MHAAHTLPLFAPEPQHSLPSLSLVPEPVDYVNPPFNYTGSKFPILHQLLPLFDYSKRYFVDMFAGGGSVYTNVASRYERVWVNDIIGDLMAAHRALIADPAGFTEKVKALCVAKDDKEGYHKLRDSYNANKTPEGLYALMLCCNCNMLRFNKSGGFNQTFGKRTFNENTQAKIDAWTARLAGLRDRLKFTSHDFTKLWPANPSATMFYSDSPYSNTEAGYNATWTEADDDRLFDFLMRINDAGGSFAVSGLAGSHGEFGECRLITRLTGAGFNVTFLAHNYDKVSNTGAKESREVLIRNYA